jgi:DedD protein
MAESQEIGTLRRRGRRRLVGAIALVLLAVIVLPMVFDSEPRQSAPPVSVRIPGEDDAGFSPKVTAKGPAVPSAPRPTAAVPAEPQKPAPGPKLEFRTEEKRAPKAPDKGTAVDGESARAEAAMSGEQFVVPVAALASAEKVKELAARLTEAKLPYYTEPIATSQGPVTRIRVGPFGDRAAAEKALQQLKLLGLKPGSVTSRS